MLSTVMDFKTWHREVEPKLRRRGFDLINSDPQVLFDGDGGPVGIKADLYLARLIGPNDEIVDDTMLLQSALDEIRTPRPVRLTAAIFDEEDPTYSPMLINSYHLQSSYATMFLSPEYGYEGMPYDVADFRARLVFLRYRRHLNW